MSRVEERLEKVLTVLETARECLDWYACPITYARHDGMDAAAARRDRGELARKAVELIDAILGPPKDSP